MSHSGSSQTSSPSTSLKTDVVDDDRTSTFSQESGVPRADGAFHALQLVAGNRVRHGRCAPEFLEEMATRGANDSLRRFMAKKFKVVSGQEARLFFRNYISEHRKLVRSTNEVKRVGMPSPIAFAVTAWDGSVKCVDYYMTWRGFKKLPGAKELERKIERLDAEFRRLVKKIDQEYNRVASLRMHENLSPIKQEFDNESDLCHTAGNSRPPPKASVPDMTNERRDRPILPGIPEPPTSATDSVMSLPLLNPVRNVPFSHRVPLRITNPDRLSMLSVETLLPTLEKTKLSESPARVTDYLSAIDRRVVPTDVVVGSPLGKVVNEETLNRTAGSPLFRTRSTKPSRLSRSSSLNRSGDYSPSLGCNSNGQGEIRSLTDEDLPEFLIVFLADNPNVDTTSWHGLERQSSIRTLPPDRHSPWIGPLARSDSADADSENLAEFWNPNPPINPGAYYPTLPVIPGAQYITLNQMGSPAPSESSYLYSSPHLDSPYVPWQLPIHHHVPHSRPPSQALSIASHNSPFIYPSTPF